MKLKLYNPNNKCPSEGHTETQYIFSYIYFIQTLSTFLHNTEEITEHCYSSLKLLLPESTTINPFLLYMKLQLNGCVKPSIPTKHRNPAKADVW